MNPTQFEGDEFHAAPYKEYIRPIFPLSLPHTLLCLVHPLPPFLEDQGFKQE
jgi:hypothetical protein